MMATLYKRYEASELEEVLVQAGAVAAGSVNQAVKGKHFRRGMRIIGLFYESPISRLLSDSEINLDAQTIQNLELLRDTTADQEKRNEAHEKLEEDEKVAQLVRGIFDDIEKMGIMRTTGMIS